MSGLGLPRHLLPQCSKRRHRQNYDGLFLPHAAMLSLFAAGRVRVMVKVTVRVRVRVRIRV